MEAARETARDQLRSPLMSSCVLRRRLSNPSHHRQIRFRQRREYIPQRVKSIWTTAFLLFSFLDFRLLVHEHYSSLSLLSDFHVFRMSYNC
jgi:hypothetical protein